MEAQAETPFVTWTVVVAIHVTFRTPGELLFCARWIDETNSEIT